MEGKEKGRETWSEIERAIERHVARLKELQRYME